MKIPSLKIGKLNIDSETLSKILLSLFVMGFCIGVSVAVTQSGHSSNIPLIFMVIAQVPIWFSFNSKGQNRKEQNASEKD